MSDQRSSFRREVYRLTFFVVAAIVGAAILVRPFTAVHEQFDKALLQRLQERQPDFVFIGDSMLGYSIDPKRLEDLTGKKIEVLWYGGAASAAWYLYLKNFVAGGGLHPRRIFIFTHDEVLTEPRFRTTGKYAQQLQWLVRGNEPVFTKLTSPHASRISWLRRAISYLFPADENRAHYQEKIERLVRMLVAGKRDAARDLAARTNATFNVANLRADQPMITAEESKPFETTVGRSFLPHLIAVARDAGYRLCFVRATKRPGVAADLDDTPEKRAYYKALEAYLQTHGCEFIDLTHDPAITAEMFSDAFHIGPSGQPGFTRHFAELAADKLQ